MKAPASYAPAARCLRKSLRDFQDDVNLRFSNHARFACLLHRESKIPEPAAEPRTPGFA
jgi:hypothetical protein